jgi:hypothetical protein
MMEKIVRIALPSAKEYQKIFSRIFDKFSNYSALVSVEPMRTEGLLELVYLVRFKKGIEETEFIEDVKKVNDNNKVTILFGQQAIDL